MPDTENLPTSFAVEEPQTVTKDNRKTFTLKQVAEHNTPKDAYLVIRDRVYDVTKFVDEHPGGPIILTYAGFDATDVFAAFHEPASYKLLDKYLVGELCLEDKGKISDFVSEIRRLKVLFKDKGYFESSKLYYMFKILSNLSILAASVYFGTQFTSPWLVCLGGLLMALFWQQSGWLAHDFLHHQVFTYRPINNLIGYMVGNLWQGFSVDWWKNKHNTHHAVPNVHGADPDVDTMPFLAWSEHALEGFADPTARTSLPKFLIDHQLFMYIPLLAFARFSWALQSILWVVNKKNIKNYYTELTGLLLHWICYIYICYNCQSGSLALNFIFSSQLGCGILLASIFSLNHNGMPIFSQSEGKKHDFYTLQVLTGRDVNPTAFMTWFSGALNYQIEHHLFPQLPRHSFHKVQPLVEALCKKHNVKYHKTGFFGGTKEIFSRLAAIQKSSQKFK